MSREAHIESANFALAENGALARRALVTREKASEALAAIVVAAGDPPDTDSARRAYELTAAIGEKLDEIMDMITEAELQFIDYRGGF